MPLDPFYGRYFLVASYWTAWEFPKRVYAWLGQQTHPPSSTPSYIGPWKTVHIIIQLKHYPFAAFRIPHHRHYCLVLTIVSVCMFLIPLRRVLSLVWLFFPFPIYLLAFALSLVVLSVVYLLSLSLSLSRSLLPFIRSLFLRPYLFTLHVYYFVLIHILRSLLQFMTLPVFSRRSAAHNTNVCSTRYILYTVEVVVSISISKQNTQSGKKYVNPESVIDAK